MALFEQGKVIKTDFGAPITIVKYMASSGQGDVYIVEYGEKQKALKWYKPQTLKDPDAFYENLKHNAHKGSPDTAFLWPDAVTERIDGSFGYIMDLIPEGYCELGKILTSDKYRFVSFKAAIDACIGITNAFRKLHACGYCYADIHDGLFFINPKTGDVLICDNDKVVPCGTHTGIMGKPRYIAPEIVIGDGKVMPDIWSDRFSLAVILFILIFTSHPLEGKRWLVACMTDTIAKKLYGSEPLFIYDPEDDSNRPVGIIHGNTISRWNAMPKYLKDMCIKAFSNQSLLDPYQRATELDWLRVLVRLRNGIVRCSCGSELFTDGSGLYKCGCCGETIEINNAIKLPGYSIAASKGARVYRCQLGMSNTENALDPVLLVVAKPDGTLGVRNMTPQALKAFTPSGKEKVIEPGTVIPFVSDVSIEVDDTIISLTRDHAGSCTV